MPAGSAMGLAHTGSGAACDGAVPCPAGPVMLP